MDIDGIENLYAKLTNKDTIVMVQGGGFIGSLWTAEEYRFRRIIKAFQENRIIVFPQTITFDFTTEDGRKFFEASSRIYSQHSNITVFVREYRSLKFMNKYFPNMKVFLVPDIVLGLDVLIEEQERNGILICLRNDIEKIIDDMTKKQIISFMEKNYPKDQIEFIDTVVKHKIKNRETEVIQKLTQFAKAKLVITDRLHGMIFSAITNTPCIALSNSNGKVKGVYEWLRANEYIKFVNSVDDIEATLKMMDLNKRYKFKKNIREKFDVLEKEISN